MEYRETRATDAAAEIVDRFWVLNTEATAPGAIQRIVPDGRAELIINLGCPFESKVDGEWRRQPTSFVAGQLTGPLQIRPGGPARILGIRFKPEGAAALLRIPMLELCGKVLTVEDLPSDVRRAIERAQEAPQSLEAGISAICRDRPVDPVVREAVRLIIAGRGAMDIGRVAPALGISTRQLERRFKQSVGISPKFFSRIQRFQRVFQEVEGGRRWVEAALACGYYDQAHLVRDFREFAGEAPAALLEGDELARHFLRYAGEAKKPRVNGAF